MTATPTIDEKFEEALNTVRSNPHNAVQFSEGGVDIFNGDRLVVAIDLAERDACFRGEYTQTAVLLPDIKPLAEYLMKKGYRTNLD